MFRHVRSERLRACTNSARHRLEKRHPNRCWRIFGKQVKNVNQKFDFSHYIIPPSSCPCFDNVSVERCVSETEIFCMTAHEPGEDSLPLEAIFIIIDIAIHETITQSGVGMDVNVKINVQHLKAIKY